MEASLKPQVLEALDAIAALYKKLGRLQDASVEAALASRRTLHRPGTPLQEAAQRDHGSRQGPQAQQQPHRSPGRPDVRHQPPPGQPRRPPAAPRRGAWRRARGFPQRAFRQRARSQLGAPRRPSVAHGLEGFRPGRARQDQRICATKSRRWRRKPASRSPNSAATCRRCRRASANPASRKRK